jgi:aerobic carbon-monoxide dehydrogenase medium subunit
MTTVPSFDYELAGSLEEALRAMAAGATPIHGGTELLPAMGLGLLAPSRVVSIRSLEELRICRRDGDQLVLGAGLSHNDLATSPLVQEGAPLLAAVAGGVGNIRVRCTGTLGGNLAFAEPRSDISTVLLALEARIRLANIDGERELAMQDFALGAYETDLRDGELITAVTVPFSAARTSYYHKVVFSERPVVGVALAATENGWRLVTGAVGMTPEIVVVAQLDEIDARSIAAGIETTEDLGGREDYKLHLTAVTIERCLRDAREQAV